MLDLGGRFAVAVPQDFAERALFELREYEIENRPPRKKPLRIEPQNGWWGIAGYVAVISSVAVLAGTAAFGRNWLAAGRVDGELIRAGEWFRAITALTLHSGLRHFLGNVGFGALFGFLAGRLMGPGVTWLAVVLSAGAANLLNTFLLDATHRSIGASTAVFAALGLAAGFGWLSRADSSERWAYRAGPLVGGLALLAFTGTGDANTDVGAHLTGFLCGFGTGALLIGVHHRLANDVLQKTAGALAAGIVAAAWIKAL